MTKDELKKLCADAYVQGAQETLKIVADFINTLIPQMKNKMNDALEDKETGK